MGHRRIHEIRTKVTLEEKRVAQEIARINGCTVSGLVRLKLFSEEKPEYIRLIQEIHQEVCRASKININHKTKPGVLA